MVNEIDDDEDDGIDTSSITNIMSTDDLYIMMDVLSKAGIDSTLITNLFATDDLFSLMDNLSQDQQNIIIPILGLENTGSYLNIPIDLEKSSDWDIVFDALATLDLNYLMDKLHQAKKDLLVNELELVEKIEDAEHPRYRTQHPKLNLATYYKTLAEGDMEVLISDLPQTKRDLINGLLILEDNKEDGNNL